MSLRENRSLLGDERMVLVLPPHGQHNQKQALAAMLAASESRAPTPSTLRAEAKADGATLCGIRRAVSLRVTTESHNYLDLIDSSAFVKRASKCT